MPTLTTPLRFRPVYQNVVWGGRRLEAWRRDLPDGPVGESWEISQQGRGMSVVVEGPQAGLGLDELMRRHGEELVGPGFGDTEFPLLIKIIDANDRLSVQVHPDDELAQRFGVGRWGKTECWYLIGDGGELYQGTAAGVDAARFAQAIETGEVEAVINRYETSDGDFFFMPARTVHALGTGCLLFEIQQSCDCTFRVYDWGRLGLDGQPRELHVEQSLATIDFSDRQWGPEAISTSGQGDDSQCRLLVDCPFFSVTELRGSGNLTGDTAASCAILMLVDGAGQLRTQAGSIGLGPMQTALVPAAAGAWELVPAPDAVLRLLVARPQLA